MSKENKPEQQTHQFQAEIKQLMHLMANALYSNKSVFMRELISNAADALDKLRYESLKDKSLLEDDSEMKVWVDFDKDQRTITITDNGIGMDYDEVITNIGTIAQSGTKEFINRLPKDQSQANNMIGQFGVGFYSAFVVADTVTLQTRRAGSKASEGVLWSSDGAGSYQISVVDTPRRGTQITLHLKEGEDEFLDESRLRTLIQRYSDHIPVPVVMVNKSDQKEETVNQAKALWTRSKSEITDAEYTEFYKHIAHDYQEPLTWSHNRVEGRMEYTSLLYIPKQAPFDLLVNRDNQQGLKLYIKRVFILDEVKQLMPGYLRFVRGVIDSSDLPLNVSRELLQDSQTIAGIKSGCVKRVLGLLEDMAEHRPEQYQTFWQNFGTVFKEGVGEDHANQESIARLLRFATTASESASQDTSLSAYVSRMKPDQDKIYYITAQTHTAAKNSPHLEIFRKKGVEVLLLSDRVDEWTVANMLDFEGKQLQSVAKGECNVEHSDDPTEAESKEKDEQEFDSMIQQMQTVLGDQVKSIRITHRLTDSPVCLVSDENDMSANLQRLLKNSGQDGFPLSKPILEINPTHPLIVRLKDEQDDEQFSDWAKTLFDQALISEGGLLEDPASFVKRLNKLMLAIA